MMNRIAATLFLIPLMLAVSGCRSRGPSPMESLPFEAGQTLFSRVGMRFDAKGGVYVGASTNFIDVDKHVGPGTRFTFEGAERHGRGTIATLTGEDGATYRLEFVPRHSLMPFDEWMVRQFSTTTFELPGTLSESERDAIEHGRIEPGMSREAVFLSVGYPPKSINPSLEDRTLTWQRNRFVKRALVFDDDDRVTEQN